MVLGLGFSIYEHCHGALERRFALGFGPFSMRPVLYYYITMLT